MDGRTLPVLLPLLPLVLPCGDCTNGGGWSLLWVGGVPKSELALAAAVPCGRGSDAMLLEGAAGSELLLILLLGERYGAKKAAMVAPLPPSLLANVELAADRAL